MIILSKTHLSNIAKHGCATYPDECCGAMLGQYDPNTHTKTVTELISLENKWDDTDTENKRRRFAVTAKDYTYVESVAKDKNLTLLGFYHSHPDHPAQPSQTDLNYAWPFFSYIIQTIAKGNPSDINSFELDLDTASFKKEALN